MKIYNIGAYKNLRRQLRKNNVTVEALVWSRLRRKKLDVRFKRQYGVGRYIIDFYCPTLKLAIELDGDYHNDFDARQYNLVRGKYLEACGITIFRFKNKEVVTDVEGVVGIIKNYISKHPPLYKGREGRGGQ